jgi:hypothetical protein
MPREGDRYRCLQSFPVIAMTSWAAPYTGAAEGTFPAGEAFVVLSDPAAGATAVSCRPVRYERLHANLVPESDRADPLYRGYYLVMDIDFVMSRCKRVGTA